MVHDWGEVVTKVALGEPGAGSPPYKKDCALRSVHTDCLVKWFLEIAKVLMNNISY